MKRQKKWRCCQSGKGKENGYKRHHCTKQSRVVVVVVLCMHHVIMPLPCICMCCYAAAAAGGGPGDSFKELESKKERKFCGKKRNGYGIYLTG